MAAILIDDNRQLQEQQQDDELNLVPEAIENVAAQCFDVCEQLLDNKMSALELNEVSVVRQQSNCDGSDSGVDIASAMNVTFQRALSINSGGYSSSNGGLDETTHGLNMSGDSSMLSCNSDLSEIKMHGGSGGVPPARSTGNYECCSENGSESSSIAGGCNVKKRRSNDNVKRRVALFETPATNNGVPNLKTATEKEINKNTCAATAGQLSSGVSQIRSRLNTGLKRASSLSRPSLTGTPKSLAEKQPANAVKSASSSMTTSFRATPTRTFAKPQKPPDSLPSALNRTQSTSMQRLVQRTPSLSRARTPGTPSDDGRWPTVGGAGGGNNNVRSTIVATKRGTSVTPDLTTLKIRSNLMTSSTETKQLNSNPYITLPRRRRQKSVEDLTGHGSRSNSISRDSRMTSSVVLSSSRKNLVNSYGLGTPTQATKMLPPSSLSRSLSARKPQHTKTRIYHETSVQTALTSDDLDKAFSGGLSIPPSVDAVEQRDQQTQSDIRDRELERLRDEVCQLKQREHELSSKLQREREEKLITQRELHLNTERVMAMLEIARIAGGGDNGTPTSDDGHDSLLMLESQIQMSGHELVERQHEIGQLRQLCRSLQLEMQRSLTAQECLLQEKAAIELESNELQDFLQHEKTAMCDALKELEIEYQASKQQLASREEENKVLRDECRHLVRLNEQRRQENRLLQTKYAALETKSKELLMQQNYSVSGASSALSGLHTRLDNLVEQLVTSYNISEHDLEDIGFQNDTQTNSIGSNMGCDTTNDCEKQLIKTTTTSLDLNLFAGLTEMSDGSLSPQRNQSFIAAVISAIRNATTSSSKTITRNGGCDATNKRIINAQFSSNNNNQNEQLNNGDDSDSTEMLDSETEPCLMMDNVLEDVTLPDSHSHNMVSSSCTGIVSQTEIPTELVNNVNGDDSLHNLSQAIVNRQQMELQITAMNAQKVTVLQLNNQHENSISEDISCHDSVAEMPSLAEYGTAQAVVDQVIELDGLITKLLKVLHLIQMDNDNCIQQLIVDKNKLQQNKEDMLEKLKDLQDVNIKLQDDLMDATQELMLKNNDLSNSKTEIQRHRNEIDRLTEDICNLSTLCSNYRKLSPTVEFPPSLEQQLILSNGSTLSEADGICDNDDTIDIIGILNLLKMWQADGQLQHKRVFHFLNTFCKQHNINIQDKNSSSNNLKNNNNNNNDERLRIYANQLENVLKVLETCDDKLMQEHSNIEQLRKDIEIVKLNANWMPILSGGGGIAVEYNHTINAAAGEEDYDIDVVNANAECTKVVNAAEVTATNAETSILQAN